jgi:hypothetical protein
MNKLAETCALAVVALLAASAGARAETWCVRHFGDPPAHRFCVFFSAEDCFRIVSIGGGICEREPFKTAEPLKTSKPAKPDPRNRNRLPDPPRLTAW